MIKIINLKRIIQISFSILISLLIFFPGNAYLQEKPPDVYDLQPINDLPKEGHPKVESALYQLLKIYQNKGIEEAKEFASLKNIDMDDEFVRVVFEAKLEGTSKELIKITADSLKLQIQGLGGRIETSYNHLIQTQVPVGYILTFANFPSVRYLRLPYKPVLLETSEGVAKTGANQWHNLPSFHSDGAKVCILDGGFEGYEALLGSELPASVNTNSFRTDGDIEYGPPHGTACAEIVHDMAPNAQLILVNYGTDVEMQNAVTWIINEGVDVISNSTGSYSWGPGDGTGMVCEAVKRAYNNGIIWVNAAGNQAEDHWMGTFNDPDYDGWHNFSDNSEILGFYAPANRNIKIELKWNNWGWWNGYSYSGSNQDYNMYLYHWNGLTYVPTIFNSENLQTGSQKPIEIIFVPKEINLASGYWAVVIKKSYATKKVKFDLFITGSGPIQYNVPSESITIPADSPYAVTVGAVHWSNDVLESYSSQGPTKDGRIKPDICAPSVVSTVSIDGFDGTSAACPHVAGAFALMKGKTPLSLVQIKAYLEAFAIDLGPGG